MKNIKYLRRCQSGFTFIELIIVMGISALIMSGVTATFYQIVMNNMRNTAHMTSVKQVENALHFITRDLQMAQTIQTNGFSGNDVMKLTWIDMDNTDYEVVYSFSPSDGELVRRYTVNAATSSTTTVSHYIATLSVTPQPYVNGDVIVNLSAQLNSNIQPESRQIKVSPRSSY